MEIPNGASVKMHGGQLTTLELQSGAKPKSDLLVDRWQHLTA